MGEAITQGMKSADSRLQFRDLSRSCGVRGAGRAVCPHPLLDTLYETFRSNGHAVAPFECAHMRRPGDSFRFYRRRFGCFHFRGFFHSPRDTED